MSERPSQLLSRSSQELDRHGSDRVLQCTPVQRYITYTLVFVNLISFRQSPNINFKSLY